jgi:hypothetical protein
MPSIQHPQTTVEFNEKQQTIRLILSGLSYTHAVLSQCKAMELESSVNRIDPKNGTVGITIEIPDTRTAHDFIHQLVQNPNLVFTDTEAIHRTIDTAWHTGKKPKVIVEYDGDMHTLACNVSGLNKQQSEAIKAFHSYEFGAHRMFSSDDGNVAADFYRGDDVKRFVQGVESLMHIAHPMQTRMQVDAAIKQLLSIGKEHTY